MARAPVPSLAGLLLLFLVYVRPLYSEFQRRLRPQMYHNSVYFLFVGLKRPLTGGDVSKMLAAHTQEHLGVALATSLHRQVMGFMTSRFRDAFPSALVSSATDEQFGHSQQVDRKHYGLDSSIPGHMDHHSLKSSLEVSAVFHRILGLGTELLKTIASQQASVRAVADDVQAILNPSRSSGTSQAPVGSGPEADRLAIGVYHHLAPYITNQVKDTIEQANASVIHIIAPDRITSKSTHVLPSVLVNTHPSLLPRLREMFPDEPDAGFKNVQQAQAAQLCVERTRSFVLVTPTGSGKTLPAQLASKFFDEGRTTVWLLPLRSLREQVRTSCIRNGLPVGEYTVGLTTADVPQNLIVSVEQTEFDDLQGLLQSLCTMDRLARIVLDEAHLVLTHKCFRPVMSTLKWLGQKAIQVVLLTATLPVNLVDRLLDSTGLCAPLVLRTSTERPNISINVTVVDSDSAVVSKVVSVFKEMANGRTLVFSRSKREAEDYGSQLGIPYVHGQMELEEIDEILGQFRSGQVQALSCTSFLGVGLDVPDVTHVIHAGLPWDILSYSQEAGRAGRNKGCARAWSYIIVNRNTTAKDEGEFGARAMKEFVLDDKLCRRIIPWTFLDGSGLPCSMMTPRAHLCDVCQRQSQQKLVAGLPIEKLTLVSLPKGPDVPVLPPLPTASKPTLSIAARLSHAQDPAQPVLPNSILLRTIQKFGNYFASRCAQCQLANKPLYHAEHPFSQCKDVDQEDYNTWYHSIRSRQSPGNCFACGMTSKIQFTTARNERQYLHDWMVDGQSQCGWEGSFLPFVYLGTKGEKTVLRALKNPELGFRGDLDCWITAPPAEVESDLPNIIKLIGDLGIKMRI